MSSIHLRTFVIWASCLTMWCPCQLKWLLYHVVSFTIYGTLHAFVALWTRIYVAMLLDRLFCPDWIMVMHFCLEPTYLTLTDFNASKIGQQNLFFCASKHDHATLYLNRLHWLPVKERIQFKILLYVFKCLNGLRNHHILLCPAGLYINWTLSKQRDST